MRNTETTTELKAELKSTTALATGRFVETLRHYVGNKAGNVALIMGITALPLMGLVGASIDYSQAMRARAQLQEALDTASLAGTKAFDQSDQRIREIVNSFFQANAPTALRGSGLEITIQRGNFNSPSPAARESWVRVRTDATVQTNIVRVLGFNTIQVAAASTSTIGSNNAEVVIALDVTGSMEPNIAALRQGARDLLRTIFMGADSSDSLRASVVPFNHVVNIGNGARQMAWMDTNAQSRFHGENFENIFIRDRRCDPPPPPPPPNPPPPPPPGPPRPPPPPPPPWIPPPPPPPPPRESRMEQTVPATQHASVFEVLSGRFQQTWTGATQPRALETKAVDTAPSRVMQTLDSLFALLGPSSAQAQAWPYGPEPQENSPVDCNRHTPANVNHFDLFRAMGEPWAGCVEARPNGLDITDDPPDRNRPDTLWVPYLWPDEDDRRGTFSSNSYLPNIRTPSWVRNRSDWMNQGWVWKYQARPTIDLNARMQQSPNASCPPALLPLTNNRTPLDTLVANLRTYGSGGTNTAEGLAWAWRAISPGAPFDEGRPYTDRENRKIIVLMTDGANFVSTQSNSHNRADYGAYGYLSRQRLGTNDWARAREVVDEKTAALCRAIKQREIVIYTILFDPAQLPAGVRELMETCATSRETHFHHVRDATGLIRAFAAIAGDINKLRIRN
jgi:Flp pilus assembly protein TadG